ncbi:MAG: hypothetical protein L3J07_01265 [Candidatus Magasanikbacteria bacterium]|nr:hypothetical protein [Candidatus Magasanikbacteria bacterium]
MKKRLITWGIIIVTIFAVIWLAKSPTNEEINEAAETFQSSLVEIGIEEVGQPIEGFDAYMLLHAFPGLFEADFGGVKSLEGVYEYKDGELLYKRTAGQPVTSAEQTVSNEGYEKLLENVSERLDIKIDGDKSAKELVEELLKREEAKGGIFLDGSFITNFEECANAGNSIMESYPRQCRSEDGNLFVEEI